MAAGWMVLPAEAWVSGGSVKIFELILAWVRPGRGLLKALAWPARSSQLCAVTGSEAGRTPVLGPSGEPLDRRHDGFQSLTEGP